METGRPAKHPDIDAKTGRKRNIDDADLPAQKKRKGDAEDNKKRATDDLDDTTRRRNDADEKRKKAQKDLEDADAAANGKKKRRGEEDADLDGKKKKKKVLDDDMGPHKNRMDKFNKLFDVIKNVQLQLNLAAMANRAAAGDAAALDTLIQGGEIPKPPAGAASGPAAQPSGPVETIPLQPVSVPGDVASKEDYLQGYMEGIKEGEAQGKLDGIEEAEQKVATEEELQNKLKEIDLKMQEETKKAEEEAKQVALDDFCRSLKIKSAVEGVPFKLEDNPECKEGGEMGDEPAYGYGEVQYGEAEEGRPLTEADVGQTGGGWRRAFSNLPFGEVTDDVLEQEGGAVEPSGDYDRGYKEGYEIAYRAAYDNAYRLKKVELLSMEKEAVLPPMPSGPVSGPVSGPIAASGPAYGAPAEYGSGTALQPSGPTGPVLLTEDAVSLPAASAPAAAYGAPTLSYGEGQLGGGIPPLKTARHVYKRRPRARTFKQHEALLNRIRERTIVAEG